MKTYITLKPSRVVAIGAMLKRSKQSVLKAFGEEWAKMMAELPKGSSIELIGPNEEGEYPDPFSPDNMKKQNDDDYEDEDEDAEPFDPQ